MYIDLFVGVLLLWAVFCGYRNGLIKELVSTLGILAGLIVAVLCYGKLGEYLAVDGTEVNMATSIVAFLLLWIVVPIFLSLLAGLFTKALDVVHLGFVNRLLGVGVSCVKYALLLSCLLNAMQALHILNEERVKDSMTYKPALALMGKAFDQVIKPTYHHVIEETQIDTLWVDFSNK